MESGYLILYMIVATAVWFTIESAVIWGLSRLLKFKDDGFAPALKTAGILVLFHSVLSGLLQFFLPHNSVRWGLALFGGYGFVTLLSLVLETFLVKTFFKESYSKAIALVAIQLLLSVILMGGLALLVYFAFGHSHF